MVIRPMTPQDDLRAVGDVYAESWRYAYQRILPQRFLDKLNHERWSAVLHADPSLTLGLFEAEKLLGAATLGFVREEGREGCGEITSLYLLPEAARQGFGKALLNAAEEELHSHGCEKICLWVMCVNAHAISFYMRNGYRPTGRMQTERYGEANVELMEMMK